MADSQAPLLRGRACLPCRRKKQKCSAERPVCQQCIRGQRESECVYDPKPLTKEEKLEARVAELEALIRSSSIETSSVTLPSTPSSFLDNIAIPPSDTAVAESTSLASTDEAIPSEVTDHLMEIFFEYSYHFNFPIPISEFRASLDLPYSDPSRPHPALLNAIYLVSCRWSDRDVRHLEPIFLFRAQRSLDESLALVDRLLDFLIATSIISRYSFFSGQDARGTYLASCALAALAAMTFALSCGLHRVSLNLGEETRSDGFISLLAAPTDLWELKRYLNVWWSVFLVDRDASVFNGIPSPLAEQGMSTPWPKGFAMFENTSIPTFRQVSISENIPTDTSHNDVLVCIKAKAAALLYRATREARQIMPTQDASNELEGFWRRFHALEVALTQFLAVLPPLGSTSLGEEKDSAIDQTYLLHTLLYAHSLAHAGLVQLHGILAPSAPSEYVLMLKSAKSVANIVRQSDDVDPKTIDFFVAPGWANSRFVLAREVKRLKEKSLPYDSVQLDVDDITAALERLADFYPNLHAYLETLSHASP